MNPHFTSEYYNEFTGKVKKREFNVKRYGNSSQEDFITIAKEMFGEFVEVI
jgi:hypothetical protein